MNVIEAIYKTEEPAIHGFLTMHQSRLFKPLKIGDMEVQHRIGMAPLTRFPHAKSLVRGGIRRRLLI
jgi:hypothetical protein